MRERVKKLRDIVLFVLPMFLSSFKLLLAWLWAQRGDLVTAALLAVASIIWAMVFCSVLAAYLLAHQLRRLQELPENDELEHETAIAKPAGKAL